MKTFFKYYLTAFLILLSCSHKEDSSKKLADITEKPAKIFNCHSAKEMITTFNFLSGTKHIKPSHKQATEISAKVAQGCDGAAKRFIKTALLLSKAKLSSNKIVELSIANAQKDDETTNTFIQIFKMAYLKQFLDMDALSSINLAKSLSLNYQGNPKQALEDYKHIIRFCLDKKGLQMPKPQCAKLAARVASYGKGIKKGKVGEAYVDNIEFLRSKEGPELAVSDARKIAEQLAKTSPFAGENFLSSYKFAIAKEYLKMDRKSAIHFAMNIAKYSVREKETPLELNSSKLKSHQD